MNFTRLAWAQQLASAVSSLLATRFVTQSQFATWSTKMNADVQTLLNNMATLKTNDAAVITLLQNMSTQITTLQGQIAAGIDAEDLAAIESANNDLGTVNTQLAAAVAAQTPPVTPAPAA